VLRAYDEFPQTLSHPGAPGFGPDFTILALGGEVVVDYSLRVHVILWPAQVFSQTT